jgi:hypothetical protein
LIVFKWLSDVTTAVASDVVIMVGGCPSKEFRVVSNGCGPTGIELVQYEIKGLLVGAELFMVDKLFVLCSWHIIVCVASVYIGSDFGMWKLRLPDGAS